MSKVRSPTLDLITRVREARATKPAQETYRITLDALKECSHLHNSPLLLLLSTILEEAVFSSEEYSSTNGKYDKVSHFTLAERSKSQLEWAKNDNKRLKQINLELQNQKGLCVAECEAAKEELRNELNRQSRAAQRIEHLEDRLESSKIRAKMNEEETHSSFVSLTNHTEELKHQLKRSNIVVSELASYRDKLESVRVRFRRLTTEQEAGELVKEANSESQIHKLVEQLRGLYYDYFLKFENVRVNTTYTVEHITNMKREFARDAGALIEEKERLAIHARNELSSDEDKKLRSITGDLHEQTLHTQLDQLREIRGGLWNCYSNLCEHFMLNGNTSLNEVHPPTWAHPLPSSLIVHQDILAIYNTLGPNIDPLTTCTTPNVQNYLSKTYISFSKRVVQYFVHQYDNERIAIAALHSFLTAITSMRRSGSTRIEMFCRALNGSLSIFSIWSYVEIIRSLSIIQNNITLNSNFDRNQAVHLLYGDFSNLTEMVDVQNHLTIYVRKYLSEEEEMNGMTIQQIQQNQQIQQRTETEQKEQKNEKNEKTKQLPSVLTGYDILMEFICGQLISGTETRVRKSQLALSARDLVNSGRMRLTRFSDCVVGMFSQKKSLPKISRQGLTKLYRVIVFEHHAIDMWDYIANKITLEKKQQQLIQDEEEEDVDMGVDMGVDMEEETSDALSKMNDKDAMKHLMGMEVPIDNQLAQLLAYLTWTMVPSHETLKMAIDEFVEEEKKTEEEKKEIELQRIQQENGATTLCSKGKDGENSIKIIERKLKPGETRVE